MDELRRNLQDNIEYRIAYDLRCTNCAHRYNRWRLRCWKPRAGRPCRGAVPANWRASIIPLVAVPVFVGTFALMLFGFSLNTLSLFGLVLSIGIVVDDAIVVVKTMERHISQGKKSEGRQKAMDMKSLVPILSITSLLTAVFIPSAFWRACGVVLSSVRVDHRYFDHPFRPVTRYDALPCAGRHFC